MRLRRPLSSVALCDRTGGTTLNPALTTEIHTNRCALIFVNIDIHEDIHAGIGATDLRERFTTDVCGRIIRHGHP